MPAVSSAPPTPSSAISITRHAVPARRPAPTPRVAWAYLATLASASQATKYAASSTCSGRRSGLSKETAVGTLAARSQRLERGLEAVVEHRRMDPARELAQLLQRRGRARRRPPSSASASSGSARTRRWIMRSWSATETSRCCAPSWRLRSSRRRSASPAATSRSREARSSASRVLDSACSRASSSVIAAAAATASDELRIVVERRVVDEHRQLAPVALDRRGHAVAARRGQLDRLSAAVQVGSARPAPGTPARARDRRAPWRAPPRAARRAACRARGRGPRALRARAGSAAGPRPTPPGP